MINYPWLLEGQINAVFRFVIWNSSVASSIIAREQYSFIDALHHLFLLKTIVSTVSEHEYINTAPPPPPNYRSWLRHRLKATEI